MVPPPSHRVYNKQQCFHWGLLRKKGLDRTVHYALISEHDFNTIKQELDPNTLMGNRQLNPDSFNRFKYATLAFKEHTKNRQDPHDKNNESMY